MKKSLLILLSGFGITAFAQDSTTTFDYNYRKGMEHYNNGVNAINAVGWPDTSSIKIEQIRKEALDAFKTAIPFLEKAYVLNSKNEKLLKALQGSYFALSDFEKSDRYKKELESLKKKN